MQTGIEKAEKPAVKPGNKAGSKISRQYDRQTGDSKTHRWEADRQREFDQKPSSRTDRKPEKQAGR